MKHSVVTLEYCQVFILQSIAKLFVLKYRNSHQRFSIKKSVLKNFAKFTGKYLCQCLFLNKIADLLKKRLWHRCFPVAKFLRTPILKNFCEGQVLKILRSNEIKGILVRNGLTQQNNYLARSFMRSAETYFVGIN